MSDNNNMNGKDFLLGAVVGSLLGAVTALLLAPKTGKELRSNIQDQYQNVSEKTQQIAGEVSEKTQVMANNLTEKSKVLASSAGEIATVVSQKGQELAKTVSAQTTDWVGKAKEVVGLVTDEVKAWKENNKQVGNTENDPQSANSDGSNGSDPSDESTKIN